MDCPDCYSTNVEKHDFHLGQQRYICQECQRTFLESTLIKPVGICHHCNRENKIHNQEAWLCKSCFYSLKKQRELKERGQVTCCQCGQLRVSVRSRRNICRQCAMEKNNGYRNCNGCNQKKLIISKKYNLCKSCYKNYLAPNQLRNYIQKYNSPFEYNKYLFNLLCLEINWEKVNDRVRRKLGDVGKFLQAQSVPYPLTWEIIENLLPEITPKNTRKVKNIRECLLALGHLLANQGKLETYANYQKKRFAFSPLEKASDNHRQLLSEYAKWLEDSKRTLEDIHHHLQIITDFLLWCEFQDICSVEKIQPQMVKDYIKSLKHQYHCQECDLNFSYRDEHKKSIYCPNCGQDNSVNSGRNYSQNTIRKYKGKLKVFFDWLKLNRKVLINPVTGIVIRNSAKIQHYPQEIIYLLWEYVQLETADPTKALILYLIIVHAFSRKELMEAQIPPVIPLNSHIQAPTLASIYSVILPQPSASYRKYSPGRPSATIHFSQAAKSWLQPLLSRYESYRHKILKNLKNSYLLVNVINAWHVKPVGKTFVQNQVREVCLEVLGTPCTIELLRQTVAIMYADKTNGSILKHFGWGEDQAFFYTWGNRELINLQPANPYPDES